MTTAIKQPIKKTKKLVRTLWFRSANVEEESLASDLRVRQVGLMYSIYRFMVGVILLMANFALDRHINPFIVNPPTEQWIFGLYVFIGLTLITIFYFVKQYPRAQLLLGFVIDVVFLAIFALYSKVSDFQIVLLYMVVVAASCMLLSLSRAMVVVLLSILSVLYQQFFHLILGTDNTNNLLTIGDSILLSLSLLAVSFLSWSVSQRLAKAERSLSSHAAEVEKLHIINQAVVRNMVNGVMVIDKNRDIIMINATAQRLLSLPIQEDACDTPAKTTDLARLVVKQHPKLIGWYRSTPQEKFAQLTYELPLGSNSDPHATDKLRITSKPLLEHGQILIIEDLTQEQSRAQQLKLASLGRLSASIAHEIRNPLSAISQASQLLMEDVDENDVNAEFYEMIYEQTKRVNSIISDVLSLSRQEAPDQIPLTLVNWIQNFLAQHYPHEFITMTGNADHATIIYFDPNQLEQIMINLVNNALRHTIHEFNEQDVEIRLTKTSNGVFIDVLDNGDGVPEEHLSNLFSPFFTTSQKGTGLGLYLSQSFSEANNAKIRYFREGQRSCFRLIASGESANDKIKTL